MNIATQVLLPLSLAFIMFTMGLSLTKNDFSKVVKFPKAFTIGFFLQTVSLPLLGFFVAWIWFTYFGLSASFAIGLVVIACCPGGVTSNMMTYLGKGDSALSISLTAIISIFSVISIPFIVNLGIRVFLGEENNIELNVGKTVIGIFLITTVPVLFGMAIKRIRESIADKLLPIFTKLSSSLFALIIIAAIVKDWRLFNEIIFSLGPATLGLNLIVMMVAIIAAKISNISESQQRAIVFECGLQNGTLAIFVTSTLLQNEEMMLPGAVYSILMFVTGGIYLFRLISQKNS